MIGFLNELQKEKVMNTQSAYVAGIKEGADIAQRRQALINDIVSKCQSLDRENLPPIEYINTIGSDTYQHFKNAMCGTFSELMRRFKLGPDSRILDIGSGCGRMAYPFSYLIDGGKYFGVDVWRQGVDWCNSYFSNVNANMEFKVLSAENNYYFDDYKDGVNNNFSLNFIESDEIDLVFAISCFSHLVEKDCRDYFLEISRILKNGSTAYITGFLIDEFVFSYIERTGKHRALREITPGCYHAYSGQDFFGGFTEEKWRQMFSECGLKLISFDVGNWAEKPGALNYQDTFIVVKA